VDDRKSHLTWPAQVKTTGDWQAKLRQDTRGGRDGTGRPAGPPLARHIDDAGTNPLGLIFATPKGTICRPSNFSRSALKHAYLAADWRDATGNGTWTWHSLGHVFCTTALFTWKLDATDVSCMAGHAASAPPC
jgi:hypothetical protein